MKKKLLSIILTVMIVLSVCPFVPAAFAEGNEVTVIYRYFDDAGNLRDGLGAFYDVDYVNSDTDEFNGGTYVVSGKVTVDDSIEVTKSANLVLLDGCELTVTKGIEVEGSKTLAIYAQSTGENKGRLITKGSNDSAGIGSSVLIAAFLEEKCGYVDIYGGYIEATGGYKAAGIGGGNAIDGGEVVVYDGEIVAKGGLCGAGIGGGYDANGGKLTVYGGKITATGGTGDDDSRGGAGIGGGEHGNGGETIIYGGEITAQGECGAAGIGGGCNGDGGTFSIYGGYVNALTRALYIDGGAVLSDERYLLGAGIGGGCFGDGGNVMLYGGEVEASIKDDGYDDCYLRAIGGGDDSDSNGSVNYAAGMLVYNCRTNKYLNDDFTHTDLTNYFTGKDNLLHFRLTRTKGNISYREYDRNTRSFTTKTCKDYTIVKKNITSWKNGWYVADTTGTISDTVTVTGDVHLILESGTILTVEGGVRVEEGSSLTIYSQVDDIPQGDRFLISAPANCAGIGGGNGKNCGNIIVHGANLVVNGGANAAAIGGGNGGSGGNLTVYNGRVTANAGSGASRAIGAGAGGADNGEIHLRDGYNAHSYIVSPGIPEREPGQEWVNLITGSNVDFRLTPASKNHTKDPESYKYYDEDLKLNDGSCPEYLPIFNDTQALAAGWYVADGELTIADKFNISGDVNLILKDGCKLTIDEIFVTTGSTLTVYGQSNGTGELITGGSADAIAVEGTLNIHGGTVTATSVARDFAGINTTEGTLNIFGGTVIADGGYGAPGIGGGVDNKGNINIKGGIVTATGGTRAAGIGGSEYSAGGNITIDGGKVTATGGSLGAGIGGGYEGGCGNITINGGEITAVSGSSAAAIGCGSEGRGGEVTVTGGTVNADGSTGIGIGSNSSSLRKINLKIHGGHITAKSKSGNDVVIANNVRLYPDRCESFKVLLDNSEAEGSPYTAFAEICNVFAGHNSARIESLFNHNTVNGYCTVCGAQVYDTYIAYSWDAGEKKLVSTETNIPEYSQEITQDTTELPNGLFVVDGEVTIDERIIVSGAAGLILKDGCKLNLNKGIEILTDGSLSVYGQAAGTGELKTPKLSEKTPAIGVGIGAELNVHGGKIDVYGGNYAAGIGGGDGYGGSISGYGGTITVYGGTITANGGADGAGIGGGRYGAGGTFIMYGGKVDAHGSYSSGIGGGRSGAGGTIIINGGKVDSSGNIGAGYEHGATDTITTTKITINGGTVNVGGDNNNIGGCCSSVGINGGSVKVAQGTLGVGYGGGKAEVIIRGGTVDSYCYYFTAIGGTDADNVNVHIYGGSIKAQSYKQEAIVATSVKVYPDAEKCERFTVKDFSGNELSGSPAAEEKDIKDILSGNKQIQIDFERSHTFTGEYVDNKDGTHSRKCVICNELNEPESHVFEDGVCVCMAKDHTGTLTVTKNGVAAELGTDYVWEDDKLVVMTSGLTVSGTARTEYIYVNYGVENITLDGVSVSVDMDTTRALEFAGSCTLILKGNNELTGLHGVLFNDDGGISGSGNLTVQGKNIGLYIDTNSEFTISASGTIIAKGKRCGIYNLRVGDIIFTETIGKVLAYGEGDDSRQYGGIGLNGGDLILDSALIIKGSETFEAAEADITGEVLYKDGVHVMMKSNHHDAKSVLITYNHGAQYVECAVNVVSDTLENCTVTLTDTENSENVYSGVIRGENKYYVDNIADGTYILTVTSDGAVTRTYTVTIDGSTAAVSAELYTEGDVNGDGEIDANDYALAVNSALGSETEVATDLSLDADYQKAVADLDGDGFIDVLDAALLERKIHI